MTRLFLKLIVAVYTILFVHLPGNRYISIADCMWIDEMAKILDEEFRPLGKFHSHVHK